MAAVGRQEKTGNQSSVEIPLSSNLQDARVNETVKPVFQRLKEFLSRVWSSVCIGFDAAFQKGAFVLLQVLNYVHPSLGPKIENVFLRVCEVVRAVKDAWRQEETRKHIQALETQNRDLQVRVQLLNGFKDQHDQLMLENGQLRTQYNQLEEAHRHLQQSAQADHLLGSSTAQREQAVATQRDLLTARNARLEQERQTLSQERDRAIQSLREKEQELAQLQQKMARMDIQIKQAEQIQKTLAELSRANAAPSGQKTGLDHAFETLIPPLIAQMEEALNRLQIAKQNLPPEHSAVIPLQTFERILPQLIGDLNKVLCTLPLHSSWKNPINRLLSKEKGS